MYPFVFELIPYCCNYQICEKAIELAHADYRTVPDLVPNMVTFAQAVIIIPFADLFICFYKRFNKHIAKV